MKECNLTEKTLQFWDKWDNEDDKKKLDESQLSPILINLNWECKWQQIGIEDFYDKLYMFQTYD